MFLKWHGAQTTVAALISDCWRTDPALRRSTWPRERSTPAIPAVRLGLLHPTAKTNWKAVEEITGSLRRLDPDDPVRYDFALFGVGVNRSSDELPPTGAKIR